MTSRRSRATCARNSEDRTIHGSVTRTSWRAPSSKQIEAKELVARAEGLLVDASDDLYAWAAARVASEPDSTLEDILGAMATYGRDYREEIHMTEELAAILRQPDEGLEKRQCVVKTIAAGIMWRKLARQPNLTEVAECAREVRFDQARQAVEAQAVMGEPEHRVAPIEAELTTSSRRTTTRTSGQMRCSRSPIWRSAGSWWSARTTKGM